MGLSGDEIVEIAQKCAQQVLEGLYRYSVHYKEPERVEDGLHDSIVEESTAANWYRRRGMAARLKGDIKTADLYEHVAKEEDQHYQEFQERLTAIANHD